MCNLPGKHDILLSFMGQLKVQVQIASTGLEPACWSLPLPTLEALYVGSMTCLGGTTPLFIGKGDVSRPKKAHMYTNAYYAVRVKTSIQKYSDPLQTLCTSLYRLVVNGHCPSGAGRNMLRLRWLQREIV